MKQRQKEKEHIKKQARDRQQEESKQKEIQKRETDVRTMIGEGTLDKAVVQRALQYQQSTITLLDLLKMGRERVTEQGIDILGEILNDKELFSNIFEASIKDADTTVRLRGLLRELSEPKYNEDPIPGKLVRFFASVKSDTEWFNGIFQKKPDGLCFVMILSWLERIDAPVAEYATELKGFLIEKRFIDEDFVKQHIASNCCKNDMLPEIIRMISSDNSTIQNFAVSLLKNDSVIPDAVIENGLETLKDRPVNSSLLMIRYMAKYARGRANRIIAKEQTRNFLKKYIAKGEIYFRYPCDIVILVIELILYYVLYVNDSEDDCNTHAKILHMVNDQEYFNKDTMSKWLLSDDKALIGKLSYFLGICAIASSITNEEIERLDKAFIPKI